MFCRNCGNAIRQGGNFCNICGQFAGARNPPGMTGYMTAYPLAKKKTSGAKWLVGITVFLALLAALGFLYYYFVMLDGSLDARTMNVHRVDGNWATIQRADGTMANTMAGMRLHAGYGLETGRDTFCFIELDADSIVKMDELSGISILQLTDSLLRINIESGQVKFDLPNQPPGHELYAIIGNTVVSRRGTLFIAGVYAGGEAIVTVLSGRVDVNGVRLDAGYTMRVYDGIEMIFEIEPVDFGAADRFLHAVLQDSQERMQADTDQHHQLVGTWAWDFDNSYEYRFFADGTGTRGVPGLRDSFTWSAEGNHLLLSNIQPAIPLPALTESWTFTITGNVLRIDSRQVPGMTFSYIRR